MPRIESPSFICRAIDDPLWRLALPYSPSGAMAQHGYACGVLPSLPQTSAGYGLRAAVGYAPVARRRDETGDDCRGSIVNGCLGRRAAVPWTTSRIGLRFKSIRTIRR